VAALAVSLAAIAGLVAAGAPGETSADAGAALVPAGPTGSTAAPTTPAPTDPAPTDPAPAATARTAPAADPLAAPTTSAPEVDPLAEAAARATRITASVEWASFTLADRRAGRLVGDTRTDEVTNSESVVKAWLAADLLATRAAEKRPLTAYERSRMTTMMRVSDDDDAEVIWRWLGADASIRKMIRTCRMTDTTVYPGRWSLTQISSRDTARLGVCLAPGPGRLLSRSAGAELLALMRSVEPSDAFGIQQAYPAGHGVRIAVKNGWTEHGGPGVWNVNCLGTWGPDLRWVLAVTMRYPTGRGLSYGAEVCRRVTTALFP
jgi:hypothetical protein